MVNFRDIFSIKYGALALLVLQNTFLVICMRLSRIAEGPRYAASTAVVSMEIVKFVTCLVVIAVGGSGDAQLKDSEDGVGKKPNYLSNLINSLNNEVFKKPEQVMVLAIPSLLYTVQNNLLYYALSHLDAATYQVGYQLKVLTTAVFSVFMLGKKLSKLQWVSLVILTFGVAMTQLSAENNANKKHAENTTAGFIAVLLAACTSGFAGVFFEKVLKNSGTSLWMRNVQMGISSILLGVIGIFANSGDREIVSQNGFFFGYTGLVWTVIMLQAIGGLVVAVVVK